jgi:hypothetical protein
MLANKTLASIKPNSKSQGVISQTIKSVSNTEENNSNETQSNNNSEIITSENPNAEKGSIQSEFQSKQKISRIVDGLSNNRFSFFGAGAGGGAGGGIGSGGFSSGGFSSGGYSSGGFSGGGYEGGGSGGTSLFARSGSGNSNLKAASSQIESKTSIDGRPITTTETRIVNPKGNNSYHYSFGESQHGISGTISDGKFGAKIYKKPENLNVDKKSWEKYSMQGGHFYKNRDELVKAITPFLTGNEALEKHAVFMAVNKLSKEHSEQGKLNFLATDTEFLNNGQRIEYSNDKTGKQLMINAAFHNEVHRINNQEFERLAQIDKNDLNKANNFLVKYGIEDKANFSARAFYNASKDHELLGSVDKTYDIVKQMYEKHGSIPDVTVSVDWFTSPRGDTTAFARSLRGMALGQQSELKYQGLSPGDKNIIHMHLMAQGVEKNFMSFDEKHELNGGLMKDFNNWKTKIFVQAVDKLIQEKKDKGEDVSQLVAEKAKVIGVFSRISGHGGRHEALGTDVAADQHGTSMESGRIADDNNQFARNDTEDIKKVFQENFSEATLGFHQQSTCFGGSNALKPVVDAINGVTNAKLYGSGPLLEGNVTVDNMAGEGENQYTTVLQLSDGTPLIVEIDRNREKTNSKKKPNGDIDIESGEEPNNSQKHFNKT